MAVDPNAAQTPIACILDSADLKPVTSIAPGELLSLFGEFSSGSPATPPPGQVPTSLDGVTINVNGMLEPAALCRRGTDQLPGALWNCRRSTSEHQVRFRSIEPLRFAHSADRGEQPGGVSQYSDALRRRSRLAPCSVSASVNGLLPLAFNPDGSVNTCLNPASPGSIVTLFLNGLGVTLSPRSQRTAPRTVVSVSPLPGAISGVWQVSLQISPNAGAGGNQISLTAGGLPVRDTNLIVWVK